MLDQTAVRQAVIAALNASAGLSNNAQAATALARGQDVPLALLDMDSLALLEAGMLIEEALEIELDTDEWAGALTLDALVAMIADKVAARPS